MNIDLRTHIGKLKLNTPIVCASGTFGFGAELKGLVNFRYLGAVITKTITLRPREGNPPPRMVETECGALNSIGLENPGVDVFIKRYLPRIEKINTNFIVSIGGNSLAEYVALADKLNAFTSIKAIELNMSCPNIKTKKLISQSRKLTYTLISAVRRRTKKVLLAKITPEVSNIAEIAKAAEAAGADALDLVNTFYGIKVDLERRRLALGAGYGGYSGPAIKPLALYRVFQAAKKINIPIIGGGGIIDGFDALEFFLCGASIISVGTANFINPNGAKEILAQIKKYLRKNKISSIKKLKIKQE